MEEQTYMKVDNAIKSRKTQKVLATEPWETGNLAKMKETVGELLELAASAPFHKKCDESHTEGGGELSSCLPWRIYVLDAPNCRALFGHISENGIKAGKISDMLAAADALMLVTWLPEPPEGGGLPESFGGEAPFEGSIRNMEHIAACSAAIQNMLIGATARDIPNYWSSGGVLRLAELRRHLRIPLNQILLGAIFLFPPDSGQRNALVQPGKLRGQCKEKGSFSKWVVLDEGENG